MKRSATAWAAAGVLLAAWAVLGAFFDTSPHLGWLPSWATVIAVVAPLAWITLYTVQGILGPGKWWRTDLGVNMVWLESAVVFNGGILAWAVLFNHGEINNPDLGWAYIGGLLASALIISWRSVIWLRNYKREPPLLVKIRELETKLRETEAVNAVLRERLGES